MKKIDMFRNEADSMLKEGSLGFTKKALESALNLVNKKMDTPLTPAQKRKAERKAKEQKVKGIIATILAAAAAGGIIAALAEYSKDKKAQEAKAKEEAQKELYRKMAAMKGRRV